MPLLLQHFISCTPSPHNVWYWLSNTCPIQERIVPPDPITPGERRTTLTRLNQVIQHRLVTGSLLPQMRSLKVNTVSSTCLHGLLVFLVYLLVVLLLTLRDKDHNLVAIYLLCGRNDLSICFDCWVDILLIFSLVLTVEFEWNTYYRFVKIWKNCVCIRLRLGEWHSMSSTSLRCHWRWWVKVQIFRGGCWTLTYLWRTRRQEVSYL